MYKLATDLASQLEDQGVAEVSALKEEWVNDTVHTYSLLLGLDETHCHGSDLKIYAHCACK